MMYSDDEIRMMDKQECPGAIKKLREMQSICVGNLYPAIIEDEIAKIERRMRGEPINE